MLKDMNDTIAAVATPLGEGGIGIVRVSGSKALKIADKIFLSRNAGKPSKFASFSVHYGFIVDISRAGNNRSERKVIDEVLLTVMRAPRTYTKEDILEINCHSGIVALRKVLDVVLRNGARLAQPGEFTQRAFLNGRIDLVQAEGVLNVISAKTDIAFNSALSQLRGGLSQRINEIRVKLIEIIAPLEAAIDFPEEPQPKANKIRLIARLEAVRENVCRLIANADKGIMLQNGISVVLAGAANVGKSSIMNALLDYERVIVTHISGTTRDVVEEVINIDGVPVRIADTAGIEDSSCEITQQSIRRSLLFLERSDLVLFVLDASRKLSEADMRVAERIKDKKVVVVINKTDLAQRLDITRVKKTLPKSPVIRVSALEKKGLPGLEKQIIRMFFRGEISAGSEMFVTTARQKEALENCYQALLSAVEAARGNHYDECLLFELRQAVHAVNDVIGANINENVLDAIFSRFCIGK
ncbi:MAG: tRNA uridine-5-carboxymethylaminomethyl(34) synthesis GTPase MnmE [Candidatus Omnitrophica bacterium]|nr:tRNA uridine-5-carboxymethylaminomethyl(34) synthesis GTPase MnmE [Candidatus Omnitrophota bacterium]MBU4479270.1 tRNA uridine-5-carboxymethylaminomethyl(34) synthesis GTPase MnmE [Candidatus Omnitrophota bacterium]MCG2703251.1 tRNA uridine-5-carboxymethylaminomethyl(34) synthesis GTPase MnmE [Candidatus Omnitrophota bacterium]